MMVVKLTEPLMKRVYLYIPIILLLVIYTPAYAQIEYKEYK